MSTTMHMNGSEEQIRQASEIGAKVIQTMDGIVNLLMSAPGFDPQNPAHAGNIEACTRRINAVRDCQSAGDMIECFGGVRFTGDVYQDFGALQAVYLSKVPATAGQHDLLMKY